MDSLLSSEFLKNTQVSCTTRQENISYNYVNLTAMNCDATVNLINKSHATSMSCDLSKINAQLAGLVATLANNATGANAAIEASLTSAGVDGVSLQSRVETYLNARCTATAISTQSVIFPSVVLSDCSGVNITALNSLDSTASCGLSKATELLQASGLGTPIKTPKPKLSGGTVTALIVVFVGVLVLALVVGLYLRKRAASQVKVIGTVNVNVGREGLQNVPRVY
jgi:hypothetical protein